MIKTSLILAGLSLFAAAPAAARTAPEPAPSPTAAMGTAEPAVAAAPQAERRYCVVKEATTGTYLTRKLCRTRAEWQARGVELPNT